MCNFYCIPQRLKIQNCTYLLKGLGDKTGYRKKNQHIIDATNWILTMHFSMYMLKIMMSISWQLFYVNKSCRRLFLIFIFCFNFFFIFIALSRLSNNTRNNNNKRKRKMVGTKSNSFDFSMNYDCVYLK